MISQLKTIQIFIIISLFNSENFCRLRLKYSSNDEILQLTNNIILIVQQSLLRRNKSIMANKQYDTDLAYLAGSFYQFIRIFYKVYRPYIKILALIILSYVAFILGRISIIDRLEQSVNSLKKLLENRVRYTIELPERLNQIKRIRRILIGVIIVLSLLLIAKYYKIKLLKIFSLKLFIRIGIFAIFLFISTLISEKLLEYFIQKGRMIDLSKNQQLYQLQKELGPKVQGLLKIFLCKNLYVNYKQPSKYICHKQKCKNERTILKQRYLLIESLVLNAFSFNWCSVCTKKVPFEQYVMFSSYKFVQQAGLTESEEISLKNEYLYQQIERMLKWIRQLSPCNCSQIYWRQQIAKIKLYKTKQKVLQHQLIMIQHKK